MLIVGAARALGAGGSRGGPGRTAAIGRLSARRPAARPPPAARRSPSCADAAALADVALALAQLGDLAPGARELVPGGVERHDLYALPAAAEGHLELAAAGGDGDGLAAELHPVAADGGGGAEHRHLDAGAAPLAGGGEDLDARRLCRGRAP